MVLTTLPGWGFTGLDVASIVTMSYSGGFDHVASPPMSEGRNL